MPTYDFSQAFAGINDTLSSLGKPAQPQPVVAPATSLSALPAYNPNGNVPSFASNPGAIDMTKYATGGAAARTDSFTGMQPQFSTALASLIGAAPPEIQQNLKVMSGYRSPETQQVLWDAALKKYGSAEAARKWVAPPGNSQHGKGNAADFQYASPEARQWARANAPQYGLTFPLSNEPWHIELAGVRR